MLACHSTKEQFTKGILNNPSDIYYSYINTLFNAKLNLQSEFKKKIFKLFLDILKKKNFNKYFLYAGSSIGLIRDGNSIPWVDDYDFIMMEEDFQCFMNEIMPELKKYCFCGYYGQNDNKGMFHILYHTSPKTKEYFQLDIFVSYFNSKDILYNINHKYDTKKFGGPYPGKLNKVDIYPLKKILFDGIEVNFCNNVKKEVEMLYGDCINSVIIHINHGKDKLIFNEHFSKTYEKFNTLINIGKQNINKIIENYEYKNIIKLTDMKFNSYIDVLEYLKANNCKKIINSNNINLHYFPEIKYFLPNIEIVHLFINENNFISPELFNYCDKIKFKNKKILNEFKKINYFNSKLKFEIINVITFGTFDLLHNGHINIFYQCRKYSENLIVGISSDKLNIVKGKKSVETENKRIDNIKKLKHIKSTFLEESLEDKNKYIHNYDSDILIMGDDWIDKCDFDDCITIYVPRTGNISTTLSSLMKKIFMLEPNFDINFYMNNYIDLKNAFGDNTLDYYSHYFNHGYHEKRQCYKDFKLIEMYGYNIPNSFNLEVYKKENPDLVNAFKTDDEKLLSHFLNHGFYENRIYF